MLCGPGSSTSARGQGAAPTRAPACEEPLLAPLPAPAWLVPALTSSHSRLSAHPQGLPASGLPSRFPSFILFSPFPSNLMLRLWPLTPSPLLPSSLGSDVLSPSPQLHLPFPLRVSALPLPSLQRAPSFPVPPRWMPPSKLRTQYSNRPATAPRPSTVLAFLLSGRRLSGDSQGRSPPHGEPCWPGPGSPAVRDSGSILGPAPSVPALRTWALNLGSTCQT